MARRNLTVQLDEGVIRDAKVIAAKRGTSISRLVAGQLEALVDADARYEEASQKALELIATARARGGRRWNRDDLYRR